MVRDGGVGMKIKRFIIVMCALTFFAGFFSCALISLQVNKAGYKQGFEAGVKHEKQRRTAWADSIRNNCKWNNGVPDSVREDFKWE